MSAYLVLFQQTLIFTVPLLLVALGGMISEKSGITNVGLEGMMVMGAAAGIGFVNVFQNEESGQLFFTAAILIAALAGGLFALIHAYASISINANQTISGTALNIFAPAFAIFIAEAAYGQRMIQFADTFVIRELKPFSDIPVIGYVLFKNVYITTPIALIVLIFTAWFLNRTPVGLRLGACGEHPHAAASVGVNVKKYQYAAVFVSGILSGIGGIAFVIPTSTSFNGSVAGYGFLALSLVIFGDWKPASIFGGAVFFGLMKAISCIYSSLPGIAELPIPAELYRMMPYVITLIVLALFSNKSAAPKSLGLPYSGEGK